MDQVTVAPNPTLALPPRLIPFEELFARFGLGRTKSGYRVFLHREVKKGTFPPGIRLGGRVGWTEAEVAAHLAQCPRGGRPSVDGMRAAIAARVDKREAAKKAKTRRSR